VAAGFLAGAVVGTLPVVQRLPARLACASDGGTWRAEVRVCDVLPGHPRVDPDDEDPGASSLPEDGVEPSPPWRPDDARDPALPLAAPQDDNVHPSPLPRPEAQP
jgi:hypothetical protein